MSIEQPVSLSFSAASLRPELVRVVAEAFLETGSWAAARDQIIARNSLQLRSPASAVRMERELRQRLMHLTMAELTLAAQGNADERKAIAWLAAQKGSSFVYDFATDVLRGKLAALDPMLRASDYENFLTAQGAAHPEVLSLTPSSQTKIRSVLMTMLREAGIARNAGRNLHISRPVVPPSVYAAVLADAPHWLAGFLVPDSEIPSR